MKISDWICEEINLSSLEHSKNILEQFLRCQTSMIIRHYSLMKYSYS